MMPEMDGYSMTEIIKNNEELKMIPVILLTAKADVFMKIEGFEKGADDYIIKPFDSKELCARIKVHIELKKLRDDLINKNSDLINVLKEKTSLQKHLEESEVRFREMAENLPVAIIEIDKNNRMKYLNKYAQEFFNISISDNIMDYIDEYDKENMINNINSLFFNERSDIKIYSLKTKNGNKIKGLIKSNVIYNADNADGLRFTILEFEPNINIVLMPDKIFYEKYDISEREKDIILNLVKGMSYKDIGENLCISYKTVDNHIRNIYSKTNVTSRHNLIKLIQQKNSYS